MTQETKRTFTQEQAGEMYSFLLRTYGAGLTDYETMHTLRRRAAEILDRIHAAIADTPDTPPAGVTGSGGRYVVVYEPQSYDGVLHDARFYVFDTDTDKAVDDGGYLTYHAAHAETARLNAAHPASGTADTVAGSGNGGE